MVSKDDAISRSAAIEVAMRYLPDDDVSCSNANEDPRNMLDDIECIPAVDAVPVVHGRWIYGITLNHEWRKCSECLVSQDIFGCFTYCPNCGAKMDGGKDDENA